LGLANFAIELGNLAWVSDESFNLNLFGVCGCESLEDLGYFVNAFVGLALQGENRVGVVHLAGVVGRKKDLPVGYFEFAV
jgi:hypothetical protein